MYRSCVEETEQQVPFELPIHGLRVHGRHPGLPFRVGKLHRAHGLAEIDQYSLLVSRYEVARSHSSNSHHAAAHTHAVDEPRTGALSVVCAG